MLTNTLSFRIPFYDMDALAVVWHGNYVKYLERGREAFGEEFGLEYQSFYDNGYIVPVVDMHLRYHQSARSGDVVRLETSCRLRQAAKLVFEYQLFRESDNALILSAETTQLFVSREGDFSPVNPPFFQNWKQKMKNTYFFPAKEIVTVKADDKEFHELKVKLNPDCAVYEGHFPGNPVSPGVCNMRMLQQCAEQVVGKELQIQQIDSCRFLSVITPKTHSVLTVRISCTMENDGLYQVTGAILDESDTCCVEFKGKMKPKQ